MLSPTQLGEAGDRVAAVYADIEAQMLDHLVKTMVTGSITNKTYIELALLSQAHDADLRRIIQENRDAIDAAVLDTAEAYLEASDKDDRDRLLQEDRKAPAQIVATARGLSEVLARDNLQMVKGAKEAFLQASLEAVTQVNAGYLTADRAIHSAVRKLEREGIPIITYQNSKTGKVTVTNKVDVAVRRHVRTQISQDANRMSMERLSKLEIKLVEVSSHADARPSHAEWQGQCYSLNGEITIDDVTYPDFYLHCMSGDLGDILGGVNCKHSFGPYRHGAPRAYEPHPQHPSGIPGDEIYKMEQKQRYIERQIRADKREFRGARLEYENDPSLSNKTALIKAQDRLKRRQEGMRDFIAECNAKSKNPHVNVLTRKPNREWAGDMPARAKVSASHRSANQFLDQKSIKAQMKAAGISKARMKAELSAEMLRRGGTLGDFASLDAKEQRGIFGKIWESIDSKLPSTKKANAGKHAIRQYTACKTKKDALEFAKSELGFESVSKALTLSELNDINAAFYGLMQRNPFMKGFVKTIKTGNMDACAYFSSNRVSKGAGNFAYEPLFKFNRTSLKSATKDCRTVCAPDDKGIRYWTLKHDASGIVAHEFAHAIEYKITMKRLGFAENETIGTQQVVAFNQAVGNVSKEIVEEAFKRVGIEYTPENVMKHVSKYGKKNSRETFAEALSCEDDANIICNEIKKVAQEVLIAEELI